MGCYHESEDEKGLRITALVLGILLLVYSVISPLLRTINDVEEMKHLIDIGADGIMTDYPHRLKAVYDSYADDTE